MMKMTRWALMGAVAWTLVGCSTVSEWDLAVQMWTFRKFTLFEGIDKAQALDLKYIEANARQKVSPEHDVTLLAACPKVRQAVRDKLEAADIEMINCYFQFAKDEAELRKQFELCKDMGIETAVGEPDPKSLDLIEKLADEYKVNIALHDHKKNPENENYVYWHPEKVMALCEGRSKRIGTCADTGHWVRSELDPVAGLKTCESRLITLHLKDVDKIGPDAHDVIWGQGVGNIKAQLAELHRQGFKGIITIEYEANWDDNLPDIRKCIAYYEQVCDELGR